MQYHAIACHLVQYHAMACHFGKSNNLLVSDTSMTLARISHTSSRYATYFQLRNFTAWWRHQTETFPRFWPFVRWIHRSPVNSPHKGQWRGALMFSLICALNKLLSKQLWGWWFWDAIALIMMSLYWNNVPMPYCVVLRGFHCYLCVTQNAISCHLSPISTLMMALW